MIGIDDDLREYLTDDIQRIRNTIPTSLSNNIATHIITSAKKKEIYFLVALELTNIELHAFSQQLKIPIDELHRRLFKFKANYMKVQQILAIKLGGHRRDNIKLTVSDYELKSEKINSMISALEVFHDTVMKPLSKTILIDKLKTDYCMEYCNVVNLECKH
ncbi:unnamed protein product, partial [Rotaria magnacalcarata]